MKNRRQSTMTVSQQRNNTSLELPDWFKWHGLIVFIFGMCIYLNTIFHEFTQDDAIVIYDNMYTTKGIAGLKGIFTKDTFFGFFKEEGKAKLVSGGRYRPFTPAMFAFEYQIMGKNPMLGHLINILLYGLLCFMLYKLLVSLICHKDDSEAKRLVVLAATLLYATHPLHTEAVANIKGRDEIMSMLGSVVALFTIIKYLDTKYTKYLVFAALSFFIALLSKENSITFLAVVPLALYFFRDLSLTSSLRQSLIIWIPTIIFLFIRAAILGNDFGGTPMELMNNPFLKLVNGNYIPFNAGEKMATIIFTLGKYVQLLVFPHPLTHDYYPRHIDIKTFGNVFVWGSLLLYGLIGYLAISGFKKKTISGFAAAYFLLTLSIVSNIVFPIGTNMSERFMFMPSLGYTLFLAHIMYQYIGSKAGNKVYIISVGIVIMLFTIKTITRNMVWESDFKLFTTDVKTSANSAKVLNAAGGALTNEAMTEKDEGKKKEMLNQALVYLDRATTVHPQYKNAFLIMGNAYYYLKEYEKGVTAYQKALALDPEYSDAKKNLAVALRDAGRQAGEIQNDLAKAETYLVRSYQMYPDDTETLRLLGVLNGVKGNHIEAVKYFEKVVLAEPQSAAAYLNLSTAYRNSGDLPSAEKYLSRALQIDPEVIKKQAKQ